MPITGPSRRAPCAIAACWSYIGSLPAATMAALPHNRTTSSTSPSKPIASAADAAAATLVSPLTV